ncbi:MAG TPA: ATP-binding protein [Vicinamibacterales bacterium]|nr:ATP-binding protein [Vicinamibacterales bacterium]
MTLRYRSAAESLETALRDLRESQEHVRRAERLSVLGEVAAGLAHEIRTPLAGVRGALEIIAGRAAPASPEAEFGELGTKELKRLEQLVTDFLAYARPRRPELRSASLGELVEHGTALLRPTADARGVVFEADRPARPAAVRIDPDQMQEVLINVLSNAIEASPAGSAVRIRERSAPPWAIIEVIDEGPGVPTEHLGRIFEPFFTTKEKGTGLGLAISSRIVSAQGGEIEAQSINGRGTTVRIRLPLAGSALEPPGERTRGVS